MGLIQKTTDFIKNGVWEKDEAEIRDTKWGWLLHPFKIIIYTAKGLGKHNIGINSAALSFYTLTALVPIAAMVFGITKGFGLYDNLIEYLHNMIPDNAGPIIDEFVQTAINKLNQTRGGIIASAGFVFLLWSVIKVFSNIERVFNNIWDIKKQRPFSRKFTDYVAVIFVAPILWLISNSMIVYIRNRVSYFTSAWIGDVLFSIISILSIWLMLTFIYYMLPNTKVKIKGALIAGIIAGIAFQIFQWGYVILQGYMTSYNVVYGSLAAIPLFLIWLQISWYILLFGAELSFAYQNIGKFEMEREGGNMSNNERRKVMLASMMTIIRHFVDNKGAVDSETISNELNMPLRTVRDVVFDLENAGLIVAVKKGSNDKVNMYMPARDVGSITAWEVIDSVDSHPHAKLDFCGNRELITIDKVLAELKSNNSDSLLNRPLIDLMGEHPARGAKKREQNNQKKQ